MTAFKAAFASLLAGFAAVAPDQAQPFRNAPLNYCSRQKQPSALRYKPVGSRPNILPFKLELSSYAAIAADFSPCQNRKIGRARRARERLAGAATEDRR